VKSIDFLIIDAEGFEYKILKQLESTAVRPKFIFFEWGCLQEDEYKNLIDLLRREGYVLYQSGGDFLAIKK
jgi:hypothetical protein